MAKTPPIFDPLGALLIILYGIVIVAVIIAYWKIWLVLIAIGIAIWSIIKKYG